MSGISREVIFDFLACEAEHLGDLAFLAELFVDDKSGSWIAVGEVGLAFKKGPGMAPGDVFAPDASGNDVVGTEHDAFAIFVFHQGVVGV